MGKNRAEKAESEVGKVYCQQCNTLYDRSILSTGRSDINLKCTEGHSVRRITSGRIEALLGFASPWCLMHISALIKNDYPVEALLLAVSFPVIGLIFLVIGLLAKRNHDLGVVNGFTMYWREYVGFSSGWLIGSALAALTYRLNLIKF